MTIFNMSFDSEARRYASARQHASLAAIITVAFGCNGRLTVSDESIDTRIDAGPSGASGSSGIRLDASPSPGSCQDRTLNGEESDIDCGGLDCPACSAESGCTAHADCQSGNCRAGLCRAPACDDGVKNGDETSMDCGGPSCQRCPSTTCNCASSPELTALECDETNGPIGPGWYPMLSADGEVAVFMICREAFVNGIPPCTAFRWTSSGSERLGNSSPYGMSRDGQKVLLANDDLTMSLYQVGGDTTPVPLPFGAQLSADGTKVVGIDVADSGARALLRWSEAGGLELLAELVFPSPANDWRVRAVNSDASSIIGYVAADSGDIPFRWTDAGGLETLGPIPEDATGAQPAAMSEDGSVVVGVTTRRDGGNIMVFRWTSEGFQTLAPAQNQHHPVSGYVQVEASFMVTSADGDAIAATIGHPDQLSLSAWRSSATDGENFLNTESPGVVRDMTPDGSVVIGTAGEDSFKWVAQPPVANEPRQFSAVRFSSALQAAGVDLTGWELGRPTNVSDDGRVVLGYASCGGVRTIYRWASQP
jgi:uncharacterized membrane protein